MRRFKSNGMTNPARETRGKLGKSLKNGLIDCVERVMFEMRRKSQTHSTTDMSEIPRFSATK